MDMYRAEIKKCLALGCAGATNAKNWGQRERARNEVLVHIKEGVTATDSTILHDIAHRPSCRTGPWLDGPSPCRRPSSCFCIKPQIRYF